MVGGCSAGRTVSRSLRLRLREQYADAASSSCHPERSRRISDYFFAAPATQVKEARK